MEAGWISAPSVVSCYMNLMWLSTGAVYIYSFQCQEGPLAPMPKSLSPRTSGSQPDSAVAISSLVTP